MPRNVFLRNLGILATLMVVGAGAAVAAPGEILYEGRISEEQWTWEAAGAAYRVSLAGGRALQQTQRPDLPGLDLLLLVPADLALSDVVVEPLTTHLVTAPGPIALSAPLLTSEGERVAVDELPEDS